MVTARTRPGAPWVRGVLLAVLTALLFAAFHCSTYPHGDGAGHTAYTASAGHEEPAHTEHGSACAVPALTPQAQAGAQGTVAADLALPVAGADAAAAPYPAAAPRSALSPIDRSGRSTLTGVCRWRV
ncbi:hypothetical protein ACFCV9_20290 [Streptomyces sp. NPDC056367]|uniref:hypothetical protein n=1 Tax=Streptomyces sp. NPDC056367 TaxID=3345797 RepID=UPI0035DEE3AB